MGYSEKVLAAFRKPSHAGVVDGYNARGFVGSLECGDAIELTLRISDDFVEDAKFRAYGCPGAISAAEKLAELIVGQNIEILKDFDNKSIVEALDGLPNVKIHCSVMGREALQSALANYHGSTFTQQDEVVCKCNNICRRDVEFSMLVDGILDIDVLRERHSFGTGCGKCSTAILDMIKTILDSEGQRE
jgi:NifU-like protein